MKKENMYLGTLNLVGKLLLIVFTMSIFLNLGYSVEFQMEWGTATTTNEDWLQINLDNTYTNPIVVATPQYSSSPAVGVDSWITNVTSTSFLIRNSGSGFTTSGSFDAHYIVMEQGDWILPGTTIKVEAGQLSTTKYGAKNGAAWDCPVGGEIVTFTTPFDSNPSVLSTRGTDNNPTTWLTTVKHDTSSYLAGVGTNDMCIGLSQSNMATPVVVPNSETIYWIAGDSGDGMIGTTEFEILHDSVSWISGDVINTGYSKAWAHTWVGAPNVIIGASTAVAGADGGWPVIFNTGDTTNINMFIEEFDIGIHTTEPGGGWAFANSGSYGDFTPNNINVSANQTNIIRSNPIGINATITDGDGNNTISNVTVTILDSNNTKYNLSLIPELINLSLTTSDLEIGTSGYTATANMGIIGETGELNLQNRIRQTITFTQTYSNTPIIIAIPSTQNNDNNPYVPIIHSINTTHAEISLCRDAGATTCDNSYAPETVNYAVFDIDKANALSWIDVGTVSAVTNGIGTPFSFTKTFTNTPSVFALPQTYNIGGTNIAAHSWVTPISTTGASLVGCDHPGIADVCAGTATESFGYVAIDFANVQLDDFSSGVENIANSDWTAVSFGKTYTNANVFVLVNIETGAQDGKYPWANSVTATGANIRYCELDGPNDCDTHNPELTAWFALETGIIKVTGSTSDTEIAGVSNSYQDVFGDTTHIINNIELIIDISTYKNLGSIANLNSNPQIQFELLTNSGSWLDIGTVSPSSTGQYTISTTNSGILSDWGFDKNTREIRLTPIYMDYSTGVNYDILEWDNVQVNINYTQYTSNWRGIFTNTTSCGTHNITDIYSTDTGNLTSHTTYTNNSFEVTCGPVITLLTPYDEMKLKTIGNINFIFNLSSSASTLTCDLLIDGIVTQTSACVDGTNNFTFSTSFGFHNWTINASDSNNFTTLSATNNFLNIFSKHQMMTKSISRIATNQYKINSQITNFVNYSSDITTLEFVETKLTAGSFSMIADFTNLTFNQYIGINYGFDFLLAPNSTISYSYSVTSVGFRRIEDLFIIGFE